MEFDKRKYLENNKKVIQMIKATHEWETTEGFLADGIISPDVYEKQKVKILIVLAETYGYSNNKGKDSIENQLAKDVLALGSSKVKTTRNIATLLWLIFKSIDSGRELNREELPKLLEIKYFQELQNVLSRIAYINVKKASNPGVDSIRFNKDDIFFSAKRNYNILKLQIESICPDLIIACSESVFGGLWNNDLIGEEEIKYEKNIIQINNLGQKIIWLSHPSYVADWGYDGIFSTYQIIIKSLL